MGFHNKMEMISRRAYGFRNFETTGCESEPCVVRADALVFGKEPKSWAYSYGLAAPSSEISNQILKELVNLKNQFTEISKNLQV